MRFRYPLHVADREDIADLWTHPENTRSETTKTGVSASIVRDLLIGISNEAYENLLRKKLRRAPVKMEIDTALNLRIGILEIVGETRNARERVPGHRIQVSIAAAVVDSAVTDADVGDTGRVVGAQGPVAYVMKLWTPEFHFSVIIGYRSPTDVTESPMLPIRVAANAPMPAVSVPSMVAVDRPNMPVTPPSTGVANV